LGCGKRHQEIGGDLGNTQQFDRRLGDDSQCPFAADVQLLQVIPADILGDLATELDNITLRRDHLHAQDVASGHPVLDRLAATGILCDVASQKTGFKTHRIAGEKESPAFELLVQLVGDNTRLGGNSQIRLIDFQYLVHLLHRQYDAPEKGDGTTGEA